MTTPTKYMFDTVFDTDTGQNQTNGQSEVIYTEQQYLAAMDQGRMIGMEAGVRNAKEEIDHLATEAMNNMCQALAEAEHAHEQILLDLRAGAAKLALAIAGKLAGELMRRQPHAEIEQLLAACIDQLVGAPQLRIHVNPEIVEILQQRISDLIERTNYSGQFGIASDADLEITDCRVEWENGGSEFEVDELTARISGVVEYYCNVQYDNQILPAPPEDVPAATNGADVEHPSEAELEDLEIAAMPKDSDGLEDLDFSDVDIESDQNGNENGGKEIPEEASDPEIENKNQDTAAGED